MTDDNSNPVDIDDLDAFEVEFFNKDTGEKPKADPEPEVEDDDEDADEDIEENEDDPLADEDDDSEEDEEEDEPEPEPEPKKKRNRTQERIEQLVAEARTAERERDAARRELEQLRVGKEAKTEEVPLKELLSDKAPQPDAVNDKGEPLYDLGEFDPKYITDLSRFTAKQMMNELQTKQKEEVLKQEIAQVQNSLKASWEENLTKTEEDLPDIREKIASMADTFSNIDPAYGEYLAGTIMSCDYGPEIMYYLSQNIGAAQKIVASGPAAATLAIGRLEAQFAAPAKRTEAKSNTKRVSDAPKPPEQRSRGTHGRFGVRADTDDLDAFEKVFYKKK